MNTSSVNRSSCSADLWIPRLNETRISDAAFKRTDQF